MVAGTLFPNNDYNDDEAIKDWLLSRAITIHHFLRVIWKPEEKDGNISLIFINNQLNDTITHRGLDCYYCAGDETACPWPILILVLEQSATRLAGTTVAPLLDLINNNDD